MRDAWRQAIDEIRFRVTKPFLYGHGVEIGAGAYPQSVGEGVVRECVDIRSRTELAEFFTMPVEEVAAVYPIEELSERYPRGTDFIIAHNVLEHSPNPVGTLLAWHRHVKNGGIMVLSLPHHEYCQDKGRTLPSLEHILMDYLFNRDGAAFESREHVYSFMAGWNDSGACVGMTKVEFAWMAHQSANASYNDLHWHAFDEETTKKCLLAAAFFGGSSILIERTASPSLSGDNQTQGDIIYVYRVVNHVDMKLSPYCDEEFMSEMESLRRRVGTAYELLTLPVKAR